TYGIALVVADAPGIPPAIRGARLPGDLGQVHRALPVQRKVRAVDLRERLVDHKGRRRAEDLDTRRPRIADNTPRPSGAHKSRLPGIRSGANGARRIPSISRPDIHPGIGKNAIQTR